MKIARIVAANIPSGSKTTGNDRLIINVGLDDQDCIVDGQFFGMLTIEGRPFYYQIKDAGARLVVGADDKYLPCTMDTVGLIVGESFTLTSPVDQLTKRFRIISRHDY